MILAGNKEQKTKYLGRMIEEPLMCVSTLAFKYIIKFFIKLNLHVMPSYRLTVLLNQELDQMLLASKPKLRKKVIIM